MFVLNLFQCLFFSPFEKGLVSHIKKRIVFIFIFSLSLSVTDGSIELNKRDKQADLLEEDWLEAILLQAWALGRVGGMVTGGIASVSKALTSSACKHTHQHKMSVLNSIQHTLHNRLS